MPEYKNFEIKLDELHLKISARQWNSEGKYQILAVHGWQDNLESFSQLAPLLPDCKITAIDLPGHGHSEWLPPGAIYDISLWLRAIEETMASFEHRPIIYLGHSLGAVIGQVLAGAFPEYFAAMICLDGIGPLPDDGISPAKRLRQSMQELRAVLGFPNRLFPSIDSIVDLRLKYTPMSREGCRRMMERNSERNDEGLFGSRLDSRIKTLSSFRFTEEQSLSFLSSIKCPTLVMRATEAKYIDRTGFLRRAASIPDGKVVEIEGNHHFHLDQPEEIAQYISQFIFKLFT